MAETINVRCCIAGGGPAGMMLGWLLARAGVDVVVLEKHADFFRDFRGDTIHPSTLELMHELGVLEAFLKRPHQEVRELWIQIGDTALPFADFTHLPTACKFLALMPQWDFLNFAAENARRYPGFRLEMEAQVTDLIVENGRVAGVRTNTPRGPVDVRADLVIGADGRASTVREQAGLAVHDTGAPIDVLWFRLPHEPGDPPQILGRVDNGSIMIMLDRRDYWQCAFVIPKGGLADLQARGIEQFRVGLVKLVPYMHDRVNEIKDWNDIKLLTVKVDRLMTWYRPGLLCIGDAAHAMSPVGGVGINLAVQDAVAAANILAQPLAQRTVSNETLRAVQQRREFPTRATQWAQVFIQNQVIRRVLGSTRPMSPPLPIKLFGSWPLLRRLPALAVGLGVRPEHIQTPDILGR